MKLSFIIVNYKTPHHLRICLKRITALHLPFDFEIIVVDNASNDESVQMVRTHYPSVIMLANSSNVGHPRGCNQGLERATGEYCVLINPDILFSTSEDIERIIRYLDTNRNVGLLGPQLRNVDGSLQYSCFRRYSVLTPLYRRTPLGRFKFAQQDIHRHLMVDVDHNHTQEVEWLLGACLFVRTSMIKDIGLMNPKLFLYFGDYEWCDRARQHAWKVVYFHDVHGIIHYHKRESAQSHTFGLPLFNYVTRVHLKDWLTYLRLSYGKHH